MTGKISIGENLKVFIKAMLPWCIIAGAGLVIIIILKVLVSGKQADEKRSRDEATANRKEVVGNVKIATITPTRLVDRIMLPGIVRPWEELTLIAEVSGKITAVTRDEGSRVKKGELIATIEDRDYRAAVVQATAALKLAGQRLARVVRLKQKGTISQSELDSATSAFTQAESAADTAAHNLERCRITAPFAGSVDRRHISEGTNVTAGTKLFDLLSVDRVKVDVGIPESDVGKIRNLKTAELTVDALQGRKFTGRKRFLSLKPIDQGMLYRLQLELDNPDLALRPGMFIDADLVKEVKESAMIIPLSAVIPKGETHHCFIEKEGRAEMRVLTIGLLMDRSIEITSGLKPGDRLIVKGQRQLEPGQSVKVVAGEPK